MTSRAPTRILVVDDDADFRAILYHLLANAGYRVSQAANGTEGLERFAADRPDLVLLDISMPDIDGLEVCRRIRASEKSGRTPILLISVRSQLATVSEGLEAGATDYVLKPFEVDDLLSRIDKALTHGPYSRP